jgi:hypothetical protein
MILHIPNKKKKDAVFNFTLIPSLLNRVAGSTIFFNDLNKQGTL